MTDERLTPSFFLSEFFKSDTAARKGIDNSPTPEALANIRTLLAPGMQRIRELLGAPVSISSGYRSAALNKAVGGSNHSQHSHGLAADFTAPSFGDPLKVCHKIILHRQEINFDQLIFEGTWVHVSFSPKPRGMVLRAAFTPSGTVYSNGLI
jgi:hypothetical protein